MKESDSKLRFAVLANGDDLEVWQKKALSTLIKSGHHLALVILPKANANKKTSFLHKLKSYPYHRFLFRFYWRYFFKCPSKQSVNASDIFHSAEVVKLSVIQKGISQYFAEAGVRMIKDKNLDFIVRFGFGIIKGDMLSAAKNGVWSYHHGDENGYRGGPPGFWEIYNNENSTGAMLQQLTAKLDGGIILHKGEFSTVKHSYKAQLDQLLTESAKWLAIAANNLASNTLEPSLSLPGKGINKVPGNFKMAIFLTKILKNKVFFHLNHFFKHEKWNIGFIKRNLTDVHVHKNIEGLSWIPERKGFYFADPFVCCVNNTYWVFFEQFNYKNGNASLAVAKLDELKEGKYSELKINGSHFSYPYLLKHNSKLYCIPENYQSGGLDLYEFNSENRALRKVKRLINAVEIVDPTLIEIDNVWYIFCTQKQQSNTELYIYFSENGLRGDYKPHPQNPVVTSIKQSRPAGNLFYKGKTLYRPAQNCASTYGSSVSIMKVEVLNKKVYKERFVSEIYPSLRGKYSSGLHTLSSSEGYLVVDAKRYTFSFTYFIHLVKSKLKGND